MRNMLPRWWLAPDYEPLLRDADGLAWQFRKASVKTLAESDFFNAAGIREKTAPADPVAQRWAEQMTACYDQWALAEPVFGQLRNCMDLAVVAALLVEQDLLGKAGLHLPALMGADGVPTAQLRPAKHVASQASLAKKGRNWMIVAGGVQINPWAIVSAVEESPRPAQARAEIGLPPTDGACAQSDGITPRGNCAVPTPPFGAPWCAYGAPVARPAGGSSRGQGSHPDATVDAPRVGSRRESASSGLGSYRGTLTFWPQLLAQRIVARNLGERAGSSS